MSRLENINVGDSLPEHSYTPDNIQLFFYNAVLWNAHRIHYDQNYATNVEGYPGLVVPGPLLGDWLSQCAMEWLSTDGRLVSIEYSNRQACYVGDTLRSGGEVVKIDHSSRRCEIKLYVKNQNGDVITPGTATVEFT
ncbi:MAG: hypothetical protein E2O35_00855 [Proteobacteria bacterium]|nr:MAG: hypothetical protein E2O35_00855 [Pseudomonadota bacterium]